MTTSAFSGWGRVCS